MNLDMQPRKYKLNRYQKTIKKALKYHRKAIKNLRRPYKTTIAHSKPWLAGLGYTIYMFIEQFSFAKIFCSLCVYCSTGNTFCLRIFLIRFEQFESTQMYVPKKSAGIGPFFPWWIHKIDAICRYLLRIF